MSFRVVAGGFGGGILGTASGAAIGALNGAIDTVSLRATETTRDADGVETTRFKLPGIVKTALWSGAAAAATAAIALNPASWPVNGLIAAKAGVVGPAAG